jgi:hypothetical protein
MTFKSIIISIQSKISSLFITTSLPFVCGIYMFVEYPVTVLSCQRSEPNQGRCKIEYQILPFVTRDRILPLYRIQRVEVDSQTSSGSVHSSENSSTTSYWVVLITNNPIPDNRAIQVTNPKKHSLQERVDKINAFLQDPTQTSLQIKDFPIGARLMGCVFTIAGLIF